MPKSQIIKDLVEDTIPLSKSLYRLYVLALDMKNSKLADWALHELKGYSKSDNVPAYRKTQSINFTYSGLNGTFQVQNVHLSLGWIPEDMHEGLINISAYQGIELIENYAKAENSIRIDRSNLAGAVCTATDEGVNCTSIMQHIPQSFYAGIIAEVKTKMIQALIALEKKYGNLDNLGIDTSNTKPQQLIADNDSINRMVFNVNVPAQEPTIETFFSKIAWNVIAPIITAVVGAIIGAALMAHLGLS